MTEALQLLVVMDDPAGIDPTTDTTLALVEGARRRRHAVEVCTPDALGLDGASLIALAGPVIGTRTDGSPAIVTGRPQPRAVAGYDAVLMRKDPPFDLAYYTTTLLLERARSSTLLINDPRALRETNEKLSVLEFPDLAPETRVTRSLAELEAFLTRCEQQMVIKPLDRCGGSGIFLARAGDPNLRSILETATNSGRELVMAQRYLPEARAGDKRILLLDGEPLGAVLRVPARGDARGNFHAGATPHHTRLTPRDREICSRVGAHCRRRGLAFVGIDVIGDRLTEINVTSPTGLRQINRLEGAHLEDTVIDWLTTRCAEHRSETSHHPPRDLSTGRRRHPAGRDRQGAVTPCPSPSLP
ncbi:MAG: glutathione synthase [Solirubrobacteraceae bacterium]